MKYTPTIIRLFFDKINRTIRYKLLFLVLFPILLVIPITLILAINWGKAFTYDQLFIKVKTDLSVSHNIFKRIQQDYLNNLKFLANSYTFRTSLEKKDHKQSKKQVEKIQNEMGFSYLNLYFFEKGQAEIRDKRRHSSALNAALKGKPSVNIEIFLADELQQHSKALAKHASLPLIKTPRAKATNKMVEDRAMVIRALYPIKDANNQVIALLDGGVLLNKNFSFVDTLRDLVYAPGTLPEGSIGTVTVFLDDVRINTNVPLKVGERALGTRVSAAVRKQVLDNGKTWVDRAFVVNDWYISSYEPIIDVNGKRVGMLYAGFLEAPYRHALWQALVFFVFVFLILMLLSSWFAIRGATTIFGPIEAMSKVIKATQKGSLKRVGLIASKDELGLLAYEFDAMLNLLEHREELIQESANQLEHKVVKRTAELQKKNDDLNLTIQLLQETRQQLVIAEKLAALGEFTAGIAHEINNPTAVILGNLDIILDELGKSKPLVQDEINLAIEQVYRIKDIIDNLLHYARPDEYVGFIRPIDINDLVNDSLKLINHLKNDYDFSIALELEATTSIEINPQECQQVLINIIVNAVHALPVSNGKIQIQTTDWKNKGVMVRIKDNGSGISREALNKIFTPFFSSKRTGEGTGLGLTVSYSIMRRYGGNITVKSNEGEGTEFYLWILSQPILIEDEESITEQLKSIEAHASTPPNL